MSSSPDTDYESDKEECELAFDDHMNYIYSVKRGNDSRLKER